MSLYLDKELRMLWQIKLLKNLVIGILPKPLQEKVRKIKRSVFPHKLEIDMWALNECFKQVKMLKTSGFNLNNKDCLELGTGWSPVYPLVFYLAGCNSLTLIDDQRLMDEHTFQETCRQLNAHSAEISMKLGLEMPDVEKKLTELANIPLKFALLKMNCNYLAPYDLLDNDIPAHSFDIITSRAVLEHISPTIVNNVFKEFYRLLRKNGAMCHMIDNSDHWEHNDKTISRLNFLKYGQRTFNFISSMNPLDYQNRLRHSEYMKMLKTAGFKIIKDESLPDKEALNLLDLLKIHPDFTSFTMDDLAILSSYLVVGKANNNWQKRG